MQQLIAGKEYYQNGPYAKYTDTVAPLGGLTMRHGLWPAGHYPDPPLDIFNLQLATAAQVDRFDVDFGAGRSSHTFSYGDFHLAPPGVACDYQCHGQVAVMAIHISSSMLEDLAIDNDRITNFGRLHRGKFRDPLVQSAMHRLSQEALAINAASLCLADTLNMTIVAALASRANAGAVVVASPKALSPAQLKTAMNYAESALETPLRLKSWASRLGLSPSHFARAFKLTTGITPHQYLLQQRLSHAENMLQQTKMPLSEIALASGFSSQAHMTSLFTKLRGLSPGSIRKSL